MKKSYCYLLQGACKTFAGIYVNDTRYCFVFNDMDRKDALSHIKFKNLVTNLDEKEVSTEDKDNLKVAKFIAESEYHNTVMGYNKVNWSR